MVWDRTAPFDERGNLLHYPEPWRNDEIDWRPVVEFAATLNYTSYSRGRSAAYFHFSDDYGHDYPMFLAEFGDVVRHLQHGKLSGTWTLTKRGKNFGVKLVKPGDK